MRQRVMLAMTLLPEPELIIADEPTTALDVTIQAQIFELLLQVRGGDTAVLLITHDMGVVWDVCDRVHVMYAARLAEKGSREAVFDAPGASLHARAAGGDAAAARQERAPAGHSRATALAGESAAGMPVRAALPAGAGRVP
jgi:ABC-type glutathione transport system ATPase component